MQMLIKRIHIENFKGCKDRVIEFSRKTSIKGINGSGKTTVADAVMWLLFGKDSTGSSSFDIRPKDEHGNDIDFVEIKVESVWDIDGRELTLVKTQKQKWVKKRGSEEQTFQGNENLYEINTIPKSEKEFKAYIDAIIPEEVFKFVSNTNAFLAQKPMDRRKTLFKLVSDITDSDVLSIDPKFQPLANQLEQFTSEEILSRDKKALSENKKKLEEIPARIDEVSKSIVEQDYSAAEAKLQELRDKLSSVEDDASDSSVYNQVNELRAETAKYKGELQDIEREANSKIAEARKNLQYKIIDTDQVIARIVNQVSAYERQLTSIKALISSNGEILQKLSRDYTEQNTKEMPEGTNICPVCHQEYPEIMKENMHTAFESEKKRKLMEINSNGKTVSDSIKAYKLQASKLEGKILHENNQIEILKTNTINLQAELEAIPLSVDLSKNDLYVATQSSLINAEGNLQIAIKMTKDADTRKQAVIERKKVIQSEIDAVNRIISGRQVVANAKSRVEELKAEQRRLSQDIANVEKEIYLLEEFNKAKVNLLSDKINTHFKVVKWKLFERQINGGYNPICEPLVNGQAYSSALNSGHKILAELDIIQALQRIYEVSVPVFLDNAERINDFNIPEMVCQLITLSVTEDSELKVVNEL